MNDMNFVPNMKRERDPYEVGNEIMSEDVKDEKCSSI